MSNKGKNKGKAFERELAKHLSTIFGLNFLRVPNSGAYVGASNSFRKNALTATQQTVFTGDIIVPDELNRFAFECKFYKDFSWKQIYSSSKVLDTWISQAKATDRTWMLVFKINNCGAFVVFDSPIFVHGANYGVYNGCKVVTIEGFFEQNKDIMLNYNKLPV